ncbi:MAG TPA: zf-HC2 domain-containing protein [Candidatus Baltobacteraceae bacterium]|nr:zf-HC2 domain-containing protein [Candidatus Baltobacteraceae bacterium]
MRCSWCEAYLDEFVEGTLSPMRMRAVAAHLQRCPSCEALHRRLRIVDALLATADKAALTPGFTTGVMQQVRSMPPPRLARKMLLPLAAFYLVAAWIAVAAAAAWIRPGLAPGAAGLLAIASSGMRAVAHGAQALWPIAPLAVTLVAIVLSIDAILLAVLIVFYRSVHPRLLAHLVTVPERIP